ncbi:Mitochondrial inner membrane protein oxa1l, partial [Coemansia aciculifera]
TFQKQHGIKPFHAAVGNLATLPFMIFMFCGLRHMATLPFTGMNTGGLWWFTNLAAADPTYILPIASGLGMVGMMEVQNRVTTAVPMAKEMKWAMRAGGLFMVYFVSDLPTGIFVFWMVNNLISLGQILLFSNPTFCRMMNIHIIKPVKYARPPESLLSQIDLKALVTGKKSKPSRKALKGSK